MVASHRLLQLVDLDYTKQTSSTSTGVAVRFRTCRGLPGGCRRAGLTAKGRPELQGYIGLAEQARGRVHEHAQDQPGVLAGQFGAYGGDAVAGLVRGEAA